ncbi:MAG: haloacid dehalogenase type II [Proteobacteria bacterium]|nr:haloacid dehalogenase type II [Pseudomonadota bacterium]
MKLTEFSTLTFDCYGTLIDWETGILAALRPWAERHRVDAGDDALLGAFGELENRLERDRPTMAYPALLRAVAFDIGDHFSAPMRDDEADAFAASVGDWPAFADSVEALAYLKQHYRLVVLSNVDNASFARSNERLGVAFDAACTAEDIGSYKPDPGNFRTMLDRLAQMGIEKRDILHTAQSLFHDIAPAGKIGLATNWINRRHDKPGSGATVPTRATPDFEFPSLAAFVGAHRAALAG